MTTHKILYRKAQNMKEIDDETVDLIVTSPPYPMIEMWDEIMFEQNQKIKHQFEEKYFDKTFELMHKELDKVWKECYRVLKTGGIVCINIGDATRTLDKNFQLFSNHARIIQEFYNLGFYNLPNIIWRKQTNSPNKFMGSGMLPPGGYVTLEHEFILIFRKGRKREFKTANEKENRQHSSYFWEERNTWFSDLWEIKGIIQKLLDNNTRNRSAAYPFEIPYRLINMYSIQGDTVLDPFLGTGTTILAAIASNRNSIGFEIDNNLKDIIKNNVLKKEQILNNIISNRLHQHIKFVESRISKQGKDAFKYENIYYKFPVITRQETKIKIPLIENISMRQDSIIATYYN